MLVMHVISNLGSGGAETSLYHLVKNNSKDRQIVVSMRDHGVQGKLLEALGIEVHTLDMQPGRLTWSGLRKLYRLIRHERPDVIQSWMYHADLVGGLVARSALNSRVCWGIHHSNLDRAANSSALLAVVKCCALTSWFLPKKIISCSERSMQVHRDAGYKKNLFTVVPNGYDLERFRVDEHQRIQFRSSLGVGSDVLLGMVGRWHPQKDHANLINAVSLYNQQAQVPIKCVLVGEGMDDSNAELMEALQKADAVNDFILLGVTDNVPAVMNGIDVHVLSSRGEAFPNVVAEAMACQTPCVVTDVGDAALIVGETGWVVPAESANDLADGIANAVLAVESSAGWLQRCLECRERIVDGYQIDHIVERYRVIWREVTDG